MPERIAVVPGLAGQIRVQEQVARQLQQSTLSTRSTQP